MKKSAGLRHTFTLLELIVVMSILFLASAMAVAVFRKESSSKRLESASLQWQNFCAGVRYRAVESGKMRQILFDPQERVFRMYNFFLYILSIPFSELSSYKKLSFSVHLYRCII